LFTPLKENRALDQQGQDLLWSLHDTAGNPFTLIGTTLSSTVTRVILQRGKQTEYLRYQIASGAGGTLPYHSWMVDKADETWPAAEPDRTNFASYLQDFAASETSLCLATYLDSHERIFGLGARTGSLDKHGQAFPIWNVDPPMHHDDKIQTMYTSIPFFLSLNPTSGQCYGILVDNTGHVEIDLGKTRPDQAWLSVEGNQLVAYFFHGPTPSDVIQQYTELTGRMPLPPRWALGHHQCRWSYENAEELLDIASTMRVRQHPCDTVWLDIDYMDGFCNFTWHPTNFSNPRQMIENLHTQGMRLITIIDPGTKFEESYPIFQQGKKNNYFVRYPNSEYFLGEVWPGTCVFPDYSRQEVRAWWGSLYADHLALGVDGVWNDMDEPALTSILSENSAEHEHGKTMDSSVLHQAGGNSHTGQDGPPVRHGEFHNAYGMEMARATYEGLLKLQPEKRPLVLTRSGTGGVQRYAAVWTGDNTSEWAHIPLAITMCLNLGLSGVPFVGMDIGGFWEDCTGELLVRFAQLGAVIPFCRNHSAKHNINQEPWSFGEPYESAYRAAMQWRYRSMPYLYTLFAESSRTGAPVMRPLFWHYPQDAQASAVQDQFLLGENVLTAPICEQGATSREVYLPGEAWFDFWGGSVYQGGQTCTIDAPLEQWPLFIRANSILPQGPLMQYIGEKATDPLTLHIYLTAEGEASFTLYEDDGESQAHTHGASAETLITTRATATGATVDIVEKFAKFRPQRDWYEIFVHFADRTLTAKVAAGQGTVSVTL
jgi:alpha-glucosidase